MADTNAMADIRGIDVDKLAKGFADEESILQGLVNNSTTSAREIRWYQKTAGFITGPVTTGITGSPIANVASKARPFVAEQSWTRQTSYVRKYFVESPLLSDEDIKDTDPDILAANVRDLTRAVKNQIDSRIYTVLTTAGCNTNASTAAWDAASGQDPIADILKAKQDIRDNSYNPNEGGILLTRPTGEKSLLTWLISSKGSAIPSWASSQITSGRLLEILGLTVHVTLAVTADQAVVCIPKRACTWKSFSPISAVQIVEPLIGVKIRVAEEGEAIQTDPKAVSIITNTELA